MENNSRRHFSPEQKVAILREHLLEQVPISDLCQKHGLQPAVVYRWQKEFFENGAAAFAKSPSHGQQKQQQVIERLEQKLQTKDQVIAEIMEEMVRTKKELGES